jgi:dienelactone hydrolase
MSQIKANGWPYIIYPRSSNVGVVVVHEVFGLSDYAKSVGEQLARNGFWAAVVDVYRGKSAATLEEGFKLRSSLTEHDIIEAGRP